MQSDYGMGARLRAFISEATVFFLLVSQRWAGYKIVDKIW